MLLGICLTALGYLDAGAATSLAGLAYAERRNHMVSLTTGLRRMCVQRIIHRNTPDVAGLSARLLALNAEHETFVGMREGIIFRGWAQLHANRDAELFNQVQSAIEEQAKISDWINLMTSDCPRKQPSNISDRCAAACPSLARFIEQGPQGGGDDVA
jgi:hypothetical protein